MKTKIITFLLVTFVSFILYWYKLPDSLTINTDYGKDLYNIAKLFRGNFTLLGPALSAGIFAGPYYYYLMLPSLVISSLNPYSIALTGSILFSASVGILYLIFAKKYGHWQSAISAFSLGISPLFVMAAREPANGLMYLPIMLIIMGIIHFKTTFSELTVSMLGFLVGIILNFDTVSILGLLPLSIYLFSKIKFPKILLFIFFVAITYLPLIVFEVKNDFVITKGIFINKNYQTFVKNDNVEGAISGTSNLTKNYSLISNRVSKQVGMTPLLVIMLLVIMNLFSKSSTSNKFGLILTTAGSLLLTVVIIRFKLEFHYLFPVSLLMIFSLTELTVSTGKIWIIALLPIVFLSNFPTERYKTSTRTFSAFENAVNLTIEQNLVKKNTPFNVLAITDKHLYVPIGNEYRFFYLKRGFAPLDEYHYPDSKLLLIFSEIGDYDISTIGAWELDQFGKKYLTVAKKYSTDQVVVYKVEK